MNPNIFAHVCRTPDTALWEWRQRIEFQDGRIRVLTEEKDRYLNVPTLMNPNVIYGKRPDGLGFWKGSVGILATNQMVVRMLILRWPHYLRYPSWKHTRFQLL
jgi:hypothetical protein